MSVEHREGTGLATEPLRERAKELRCLYAVSDVMDNSDLTLEESLERVVEKIPEGWQYPDACRARIVNGEDVYETPGFEHTTWVQRANIFTGDTVVGSVEVAYLENRSPSGDDPFLLEENKLIHTIAGWLGRCIRTKQEPDEAETRAAEAALPAKPEWGLILDFLKETDAVRWRRVLRRLMNHLSKLGVPGVQGLITQFDPAIYAERDRDSKGANQPLPRRGAASVTRLFDELIQVASLTVPPEHLTVLLKQWMRQESLGFLALATEQRDRSLVEFTELVNRFCRYVQEGEAALSAADELNVRVALARRFLTDRLSYIGAAKQYLSIHDYGRLLTRIIGPPQGEGKLGGKTAGLFLAEHILKKLGKGNPLIERIRAPHAWHITSDGLFEFVRYNSLEDTQSFKYSSAEEVRQGYPYIEQIFKHSFFTPEVLNGLKVALDDLGDWPLIVRSSSLLEDNEGSAFSGKYRSLFLPNTGSKEERLSALTDAIAEVYASVFGPDPIQYRKERGLVDFIEEMGILIQRVVGTRMGKYFLPAFAGVAFTNNEFRWSPRIRREDGIVRLVAGLGTRAVDRLGDDYTALVCLGQPGLRINATPEEAVHYSQRYIDVLNLETGKFESPSVTALLSDIDGRYPVLERIISTYADGSLRKPLAGMTHGALDQAVVTFAGLLEDTDFLRQIRDMLRLLEKGLGTPVDVEFAHDGKDLYILQCRPQSSAGDDRQVTVPAAIPAARKIFSANRYVTNAQLSGIRYVVYVDPTEYGQLHTWNDMVAVGEIVSRLNALLPRRSFILVGPGRWGSRGDITLGVRVTYADISNTQMIVEVARKRGNYVPDLSFGTHFFQDLVEAKIRYLALYPDEDGVVFNEEFFLRSSNQLVGLLPEYAYLEHVVRIIDVAQVAEGCELQVMMDGERDEALAFLAESGSRPR